MPAICCSFNGRACVSKQTSNTQICTQSRYFGIVDQLAQKAFHRIGFHGLAIGCSYLSQTYICVKHQKAINNFLDKGAILITLSLKQWNAVLPDGRRDDDKYRNDVRGV